MMQEQPTATPVAHDASTPTVSSYQAKAPATQPFGADAFAASELTVLR